MPKYHPMHNINNHKDRNPHIRCQKARCRPIAWKEDRKPVEQTQQRKHHQCDISAIWLHERLPGDLDLLRTGRFPELEIDDAAADPADESRRVGQVDEPVEDDGSGACAVKVSESAEERGDADGVVRYAVFRAGLEDAWGGALDREGVEAAAGDVEEGVAGAPGGHDYDGVDDAGKGRDAGILDTDDEGGRAGA